MKDKNKKQDDVTCKEVMHHICENLGEDPDSPRCVLIKQHLENCEGCNSYFHSIETTVKFYKEYNVNLSNEAHNKLLDVLGLNEDPENEK